uniref:Uncharacterized protein n=1 Tax=Opuntia streptacantha TaxID=393608 RepID=A0A7C9DV82_OPUST
MLRSMSNPLHASLSSVVPLAKSMCSHETGERNSARRGVPLVYSPEHAEMTRGTDLQCGPPRGIFFLSFVLTKRSGWEGEMKEVTRLGAVPSRIGNRGRLRKRGVDFFNKPAYECYSR